MTFSRRRLLVSGAVATAVVVGARPRRSATPMLVDAGGPMPSVEAALAALEQRYNALVGLHGVNLLTGRAVDHRADAMFATCSAFKAYVAGLVLKKDQRGELRLGDMVYIDPAALLAGASPVTGAHVGGYLPLSELCAAAVRHSDNTATNVTVAMLGGPSAITDFARSCGDDRTWMVRWEPELNSALPGDPRDTTSPRAIGTGFLNMLTGDVFDEPHRALINEWMSTIVTGDKRIRAGLRPGWTVADKTGSGDFGSTNDIGVARGPGGEGLLLAVMTRTQSDDPEAPWLDALIADVTAVAAPWLLAEG